MFYRKKLCLYSCVLSLFVIIIISTLVNSNHKNTTVGIIVPLEHQALTEIVDGFKSAIREYDPTITVVVKNALGDLNVQKSIIEQFKSQYIDLMVPVSMGTTQMAANLNSKIPIISLAAMYDDPTLIPNNVAGVSDEIGAIKKVELLKSVFPTLKKFTLIYSGSEKILPEVNEVEIEASKIGVTVQKMMIKELRDLYTISRMISSNSELILILKDNLIASGVLTLVKEADKRQIPLVTSDEATIEKGGTFALGVKERQIGVQGAKLASRVLSGENVANLPFQQMENLTIFFNPSSCKKHNIDFNRLKVLASNMHYSSLDVSVTQKVV
ncbi:MAG: hypothetical protein HRT87_10640 [Legionellales bacterium]|nr:hypothetical protein [Legionellales bacterium]